MGVVTVGHMGEVDFRTELEQGSFRQFWWRELVPILSTLGRLVYLASLRDSLTGQYRECGLAEQYGPEEADRVLRLSHTFVFEQWLAYTLEQQTADLGLYLSAAAGANRTRVAQLWLQLEPYRTLLPESAQQEEKDLFLSDLRMVLELISRSR